MDDKAKTSELIECANKKCLLKRWYHLGCVGLSEAPPELEDWWCSEVCRKTGASTYCICKQVKDDDTVVCSNPSCEYGQKFHKSCVGLKGKPGK